MATALQNLTSAGSSFVNSLSSAAQNKAQSMGNKAQFKSIVNGMRQQTLENAELAGAESTAQIADAAGQAQEKEASMLTDLAKGS